MGRIPLLAPRVASALSAAVVGQAPALRTCWPRSSWRWMTVACMAGPPPCGDRAELPSPSDSAAWRRHTCTHAMGALAAPVRCSLAASTWT